MVVIGSYYWVLFFSTLGGLLSVCAAALYLILPEAIRDKSLDYLLSFAIGMLLGAGFLHLLPEAIEHAEANTVDLMGTALLAILLFFVLEKGLIWRHHHHHHHRAADQSFQNHLKNPAGTLNGDSTASVILVGDMVHNFLDGVVIAAAFSADPSLGVVTALAVIAHEIPQELGDFAILLGSGYSRKAALVANLLTSLAMIV
jgi:zinc and cadmium transporter